MLSENQKHFLATYKPADSMFTSFKEMEEIEEALNLKDEATNLQEVRNDTVRYYSDRMEETTTVDVNGNVHRGAEFMDFMDAMQSVTAVIDNIMFRKHLIY